MNNNRDCEHGRQTGKCADCDLATLEHQLAEITAERDQLAAQVEMLQSFISQQAIPNLLVLSDDYPQCLGINSAITDANELVKMAPDKCLSDIRAKAVMNFAELPRDVYLSGGVTAELTVYDVYQLARYHVKANYGYDTQPWDDDGATTARNALNELSAKAIESIDPVNFVSIALRHTTVSGDFDYQDIKDAFNFLAAEHRQAAKDGA